MAWTDERVEQLKTLWAEGLSASQIATRMGGVTRNAVIGKVHRLGLSGRATPAKPQRGRVNSAGLAAQVDSGTSPLGGVKAPEKLRPIAPEPDFAEPLILSSGDKTTVPTLKNNMCKWPIGDPSSEEFHFCGQSASSGKSYCAYHAQLAFQPAQKRERPKVSTQRILPATRKAG